MVPNLRSIVAAAYRWTKKTGDVSHGSMALIGFVCYTGVEAVTQARKYGFYGDNNLKVRAKRLKERQDLRISRRLSESKDLGT